MRKPIANERARQAVLASIVVAETSTRSDTYWTVEIECPGRLGTFQRDWSNPGGRLAADQVQDLCSWVADSVSNALVAWGGVQGVLDP